MKSRTLLCAAAMSLLLAACAAPAPNPPPPAGSPASTGSTSPAYRPGAGTVESASVLSLSSAPAAAGGTAGPATSATMAYRLKMADGTTQDVVQAGERFEVGDRVELTREGRLVRP
ncbi:MAG TPA: hypothetical protein VNH16_21900 [Burkholderiales bacterium]|jgi:hypothetical protein|nr:hypothetical protein [Burkholderiales bacterium]